MHWLKVAFTCSITCLLLQTSFFFHFSPLFLYRDSQLKYFFSFKFLGIIFTRNVEWMKRKRFGWRNQTNIIWQKSNKIVLINGRKFAMNSSSLCFFHSSASHEKGNPGTFQSSWSIRVSVAVVCPRWAREIKRSNIKNKCNPFHKNNEQ